MWVPQTMIHFLLATAEDDLSETLLFLGRSGQFHLVELKGEDLSKPDLGLIDQHLKEQLKTLDNIIAQFNIYHPKNSAGPVVPEAVALDTARFLDKLRRRLGDNQKRLKRLKKEEKEINFVLELLSIFPDYEIRINQLREGEYFNMVGGSIPAAETEALDHLLETTDIIAFQRPAIEKRVPVILFYPQDQHDPAEKALKRIRFKAMDRFNQLTDPIDQMKEAIEIYFWEIKEERTEIQASINRMSTDFRIPLITHREKVNSALIELEWINKMGKSDSVYFIEAYLPEDRVAEFKKREKEHALYILREDQINRSSPSAEKVPVKLHNPKFIRPFEKLVTTYGVPSYRGIDPTIPTMVTFLLMFGIMFGDMGYGLLLALAGLGFYVFKLARHFAYFLTTMGVSSILFGALFGEVFGTHLFHPFWFGPFDNTQRAMILAAYFGIGIVGFGFVLHIVADALLKNKESLWLSGEGIPGLCFYGALVTLLLSVVYNQPAYITTTAAIILLLAIFTIGFGKTFQTILQKNFRSDHLMDSLVDLFHLSLVVVSNTLSFIRVAAFNIAHVILALSVIQIARMLGSVVPGGKISTLILGHLFIVVLETLIVFIQSLRLEYYEFYSRFFKRGATLYKPARLI